MYQAAILAYDMDMKNPFLEGNVCVSIAGWVVLCHFGIVS